MNAVRCLLYAIIAFVLTGVLGFGQPSAPDRVFALIMVALICSELAGLRAQLDRREGR